VLVFLQKQDTIERINLSFCFKSQEKNKHFPTRQGGIAAFFPYWLKNREIQVLLLSRAEKMVFLFFGGRTRARSGIKINEAEVKEQSKTPISPIGLRFFLKDGVVFEANFPFKTPRGFSEVR
jgi:hypothetical protein